MWDQHVTSGNEHTTTGLTGCSAPPAFTGSVVEFVCVFGPRNPSDRKPPLGGPWQPPPDLAQNTFVALTCVDRPPQRGGRGLCMLKPDLLTY